MEPGFGLVFVVLMVAAVVVLAILGARADKKRRQDLAALAANLGLRFHEKDPFGLAARLEADFPLLREGSRRYAYNVIAGKLQGHEAWLFDHHHETYSTDSKGRRQTHHHHRSFVVLDHDVDLGRVDARPEGIFDKLAAAFGFDDIDFESAEFSRRYHVKAEDRRLAYDIFHPRMIEYMLSLKPLRLATSRDRILATRGSGRFAPEEFRTLLSDLRGILERVPRYVRKDRPEDPA